MLGFIQCWFVELIDVSLRWRYLLRRPWFFMLFFGSSLGYGLISMIPGLDSAITDDSTYSVAFVVVLSSALVIVIGILVWHVFHAKATLRSSRDFISFIFFRLIAVAIMSLAYYMIHSERTRNGRAKLHLHHYFIAWLLSLITAFNHPLSISSLAISSSIFVQGISAYSAASMFYRGDDTDCPEFLLVQ